MKKKNIEIKEVDIQTHQLTKMLDYYERKFKETLAEERKLTEELLKQLNESRNSLHPKVLRFMKNFHEKIMREVLF